MNKSDIAKPNVEPVPQWLADAVFNVPVPDEIRCQFLISQKWPLHMQWAAVGFLHAFKLPKRRRGRPSGSAGKGNDVEIVENIEAAAKDTGLSFNEILARAIPFLIEAGQLQETTSEDDGADASLVDPTTHPHRLKRVKNQMDKKREEMRPHLVEALRSTDKNKKF